MHDNFASADLMSIADQISEFVLHLNWRNITCCSCFDVCYGSKKGGEDMSNITKKFVLKAVATIGKKSAEIGCNSASIFGYHQPKEPANIKAQFDANKKN